ncbi:RRM domain-containing protein [Caerostris darwini]|uniref:RRM domain-containing protein n=1 Tax=Caerostris darwini TaxID=1538125 RepID=A0AAV4V0A2_9ARAC|nr:RRM domain-containing protein [Caerostris darwini]
MAAPRTKLFVGHLPEGCTNFDLENLFKKYGTVTECDAIGKYGFVHMGTSEEAEDAIKGLNNFTFRGSSLSVERSKSKLHPEPGAPGRAKGGMPRGIRGGGGGFYGGRGGYRGGYSNGFNGRYDPPFPTRDRGVDEFYGDRYGGGSRMRPYPMPFERPSLSLPRDEYGYRSSPYSVPPRDPYTRSLPPPPPRDLYERRTTAYPSSSDYLYSRRSPPPQAQIPSSDGYNLFNSDRPYWYGDSYDDIGRAPPTASRRPYF